MSFRRLLLPAALLGLILRRQFTPRYSLAGRRVLITGGSRGLGLAIARELAGRGARLALLARDAQELDVAAEELREKGAEVHTFVADVTSGQELEDAVAGTARALGGLDVLMNVAGVIQASPLANLTLSDYRESMETNFFAPLRAMEAARPHLRKTQGRVLNVASVGGKVGVPHLASYCASKFALVGLGQSSRAELAQEGITVTTVCPGLLRTGSARNATIKGRRETEYALFATLDNLPGVSMNADEAARRMLIALERGDAEVMIGGPAQGLKFSQAFAPQLLADLLTLGARFLPAPGQDASSRPGREVESRLTRTNPIKRRAEAGYNEEQA